MNLQRATMGKYHGWMHECGNVDWLPIGHAPADGGCDQCESGSDNASDWRPLYTDNAPKSHYGASANCEIHGDACAGDPTPEANPYAGKSIEELGEIMSSSDYRNPAEHKHVWQSGFCVAPDPNDECSEARYWRSPQHNCDHRWDGFGHCELCGKCVAPGHLQHKSDHGVPYGCDGNPCTIPHHHPV